MVKLRRVHHWSWMVRREHERAWELRGKEESVKQLIWRQGSDDRHLKLMARADQLKADLSNDVVTAQGQSTASRVPAMPAKSRFFRNRVRPSRALTDQWWSDNSRLT